jgi:hypothetical protein
MTEATLTCPKCKNEIKLTDSLLEPLTASTRQKFEQALAQKDEDVVRSKPQLTPRRNSLPQAGAPWTTKSPQKWNSNA